MIWYQEPQIADDSTTQEEIYKLRVVVWEATVPAAASRFPDGYWIDEHDGHAHHWVMRDATRVLAAARLCVHDSVAELPASYLYSDLSELHAGPVASFNRLVVHPDAQRHGFSKKLDQARRDHAVQLGCHAIFVYCWKLSGEARLRSLQRQGFRPLAQTYSKQEPPFGAAIPLRLLLDKVAG